MANINFDSEALRDVENALYAAYNRIGILPTLDEKAEEATKRKIIVALGHIQAQRAVSQGQSIVIEECSPPIPSP